MILALNIPQSQQEQAKKLLEWLSRVEFNVPLLICVEEGALLPAMTGADTIIRYRDEHHKYPESANLAFSQIANYVEDVIKQPFLYLEPDCVPMFPGWLEKIEAEYAAAEKEGKAFLGDLVQSDEIQAMSTIGVYPARMSVYAGQALIAHELPWTVQAVGQIAPRFKQSQLIQHAWDGTAPRNGIALYHPDRDGSILKNLSVPVLAEPTASDEGEKTNPANVGGEARESTIHSQRKSGEAGGESDSCGAQTLPAPGDGPNAEEKAASAGAETIQEPRARSENFGEPWADKAQSIGRIQELCVELKTYCTTPIYTSTVRKTLKHLGVIR